jgi:hypothetical protein
LYRFCYIFDEMESVGSLNRLWSASPSSGSIIATTIATDQFDFRMSSYPSFCRFRFAVRQQIEHFVAC